MKKSLLILAFFSFLVSNAQPIQPGFDKEEYLEMMRISAHIVNDTHYTARIPKPERFSRIYHSNPMGLDNLWDLWTDESRKHAVISIRGTTLQAESWLENFYAAMVPASGELKLDSTTKVSYHLADDPRAAVHVGWLIGMEFLFQEIQPVLDSLKALDYKDVYIVGHSQGGGIAYLLSSKLRHLQLDGSYDKNIRFKTYCSAAPKPGNLFYAYDYESQTQNGWAYNVVNAYDWVPEVPISIQTLNDFNEVNPFRHAEGIIKSQSFPKRIVFKRIFNKLNNPTVEAQKNYQKYLGDMTSKIVKKSLPGLETPDYVNSNNYVRTGIHVVLNPDNAYREKYPNDSSQIFMHHFHENYMFLAERLNTPFWKQETPSFCGSWVLKEIADTSLSLDSIYLQSGPTVNFDCLKNFLQGNSGCNQYSTGFSFLDNSIKISGEVLSTKKFCRVKDEIFLSRLVKSDTWFIKEDKLYLMSEGKVLLVFER